MWKNRSYDVNLLSSAANGNIKAIFTTALIQPTKISLDAIRGILCVTNRKDNYISFVTLYVLYILNKKTDVLTIFASFSFCTDLNRELGVLSAFIVNKIIN